MSNKAKDEEDHNREQSHSTSDTTLSISNLNLKLLRCINNNKRMISRLLLSKCQQRCCCSPSSSSSMRISILRAVPKKIKSDYYHSLAIATCTPSSMQSQRSTTVAPATVPATVPATTIRATSQSIHSSTLPSIITTLEPPAPTPSTPSTPPPISLLHRLDQKRHMGRKDGHSAFYKPRKPNKKQLKKYHRRKRKEYHHKIGRHSKPGSRAGPRREEMELERQNLVALAKGEIQRGLLPESQEYNYADGMYTSMDLYSVVTFFFII